MIVISQTWEFTPKGNSHLNYLTQTSESSSPPSHDAATERAKKKTPSVGPLGSIKTKLTTTFDTLHLSGLLGDNRSMSRFDFDSNAQKWHLRQINEYSENEIYIKGNRVVISFGSDNDSKQVRRSFTFDSPIIECNWFNFRTDSNEFGLIQNALCIFELQKLHVYFPNGSDFHVHFPFKLKNIWKLRDGVLLERHTSQSLLSNTPGTGGSQMRGYQTNTPVLFTMTNPFDEIKPVLIRNENKGRENHKPLIVDVIECLNLALVFNPMTNAHMIYRINDYVSEDPEIVNNMLNGTILTEPTTNQQAKQAAQTSRININATPVARQRQQQSQLQQPGPIDSNTSCLSMSINQTRKRLSVSPIISTVSFYNKQQQYVNSPLAATATANSATATSTGATSTTNNNNNLISATAHQFNRNFSPMAALSRSPSCSSSPAIINTLKRNMAQSALANNHTGSLNQTLISNRQPVPSIHQTLSNPSFMTPLIEVNSNSQKNLQESAGFGSNSAQFRTPMNQHSQTPNYNRLRSVNFTPQFNNTTVATTNAFDPLMSSECMLYEQMMTQPPEYSFELVWTEPSLVSGDSSLNEKANKFFYINDLYNQKYVCYLMPNKSQLRCVRVDCLQSDIVSENVNSLPFGSPQINGPVNYISARDACFIESRSLMVVLDITNNLFVYSGLSKLCKLRLNNVSLSNMSNLFMSAKKPQAQKSLAVENMMIDFNSSIVTPIKSKSDSNEAKIKENLQSTQHGSFFKTPKSGSAMINATPIETILSKSKSEHGLVSTGGQSFSVPSHPAPSVTFSQHSNDFRSLQDATGSRFSVKLADNRIVRVNLTEPSTCKLVNMCMEAFKYTLSKEIYYEIIQQWYISRYSISTTHLNESVRNQLHLFLYLLLNLCGCFDMARLETEIPFLCTNVTESSEKSEEKISESSEPSTNTAYAKRVRSDTDSEETNADSVDDDSEWDAMLKDDFVFKMSQTESHISSLRADLKKRDVKIDEKKSVEIDSKMSKSATSSGNENIKLPGGQFQARFKRTINLTSQAISSSFLSPSVSSSIIAPSGGILYPYLKNILFTLHLVYEECKLYRSLSDKFCQPLVQILYLLANELNLPMYINYYESEYPSILLPLKQKKLFNPPRSSSSSGSLPALKNSLSYMMSQEPPVLHKFLYNLINTKSLTSIVNPFPIINSVSKRTIKAIKIYSVIALCNNFVETEELDSTYFDEFLNQLFFKVNFSGFQQSDSPPAANSMNNSFQLASNNYLTLKFNFKPGKEFIYENIFSLCLEMGLYTMNEIYDYPFAVLLPILEAVNWSRENPCFSWPAYAFDLIGRNDLAVLKANTDSIMLEQQTSSSQEPINEVPGEWLANLMEQQQQPNATFLSSNKTTQVYKQSWSAYNMLTFGKRRPMSRHTNNEEINTSSDVLTININQSSKKDEEDGMQHVLDLETLKCRFADDLRIRELRSCLQTTRPILIKLNQGPDVSDHEFIEEEERFLLLVCQRTMSLPVARGIFTLHTINPIPTEPVIMPELNLKGKSLSKKTTIDLSRIEVPTNMTYWPLFHNGVAAGLTISPQARDLSNSWIKSHLAKNFELTNEQAGFLLGLGLTGHLANFSMLNIHDALTRRHDLTNIAILLGLASSKMGSLDLNVTRLISMHIKALMPPVEIELEIPYNIQIAALLSLGLVYVRSANKHISYVLLKEIGRLPGNEIEKDLNSLDREAYSLTAGLALGLILLEKGKKSLTIMDSTFTDELYHYMVGGHKEKYSDKDDKGVSYGQTGQSSGQGNLAGGQGAGESNFINLNSNSRANAGNNSSYIREGESINTNVTCPGATLALGLIYFNSCDKLIGEWFAPPDSAYLLDSIRPDFLLLRTLARNLIMWKNVMPTQNWLVSQLSNLLKSVIKSDRVLNEKLGSLITAPESPEVKKSEPIVKINYKKPGSQSRLFDTTETSEDSDEDDPFGPSSEDNVETADDEECTETAPSAYETNEDDMDEDYLNADTDEDNNVVVDKPIGQLKKQSKHQKQVRWSLDTQKKAGETKESQHVLGDIIEFADVMDDFLPDDDDEEEEEYKRMLDDKKKKGNSSDDDNLDIDYDDLLDLDEDSSSNSQSNENLIDEETKLEAFRHIIAGACMSIGLKFASSFNNEAYQTLLFWAKYLNEQNDSRLSTENCLCVVVLSLSMVMAGSGDLEVFRLCRYLKSRINANMSHVTYGSHMAVNMAIGLLFMGGGRYALKTDSLSVALMLCAFYPHFPVDSHDNRFHLQAFRHLYVLASEPRLLLSKDVDTNEFCYVPVEITLKNNEHHSMFKYKQMAPCILPELNKIKELRVLGPRYYPIRFQNFDFNELKNILLSELLVKQKNGYFSYSDDPKDEKAFNIRNFLNKVIIPHKITPDLLEQITNEEHINLFAQMLNRSSENRLDAKMNRLLKLIYESVVQETFDFAGVMLLLDKETSKEPTSQFIQQIKLVDSFYKGLKLKVKSRIVTREFLNYVTNTVETRLNCRLKKRRELIKSYIDEQYNSGIESLIHYCVLNDISKSDLDYFASCEKFSNLFEVSTSSKQAIQIEKQLKLFQLMK